MKRCGSCGIEKEKHEFNKNKRTRDGLQRACKLCHKKSNQKHYVNNAALYKTRSRTFKDALKIWFYEIKQQYVCSICGEDKHWRLDFHHTDPSNKLDEVSRMICNQRPRQIILNEIKKCICVCKNCHADIHYNEELQTGGPAATASDSKSDGLYPTGVQVPPSLPKTR